MKKTRGKSKLTEEQKLLRLEEQKLREEEMKRNKEELLGQYLKIKLAKEEVMAQENLDKINLEWLSIMREAKSKELKRELTILSQVFESTLDRKDYIKEGLLKDIEEAEEQFLMAKRSHMEGVDKLIDFQKKRLQQMSKDFNEQEGLLLNEFDAERTFMEEQHRQEVIRLENIIYAMEETFLEKEEEARAEFQSNMDELKNRNLEDIHTLRLRQENLLEGLLSQFKNAMKVHQEATEERKKGFDELKEKDDISTREIEQQKLKIESIRNEIKKAKSAKKTVSRDWEAKCKEIKHEKDVLGESMLCLKTELNEVQAFEKDCLAKLVLMTRDTLKKMKEKVVKGENILKAAERCRKLESEHEKVLPFYKCSLLETEVKIINEFITEEPKEPLTKIFNDFVHHENFWKRYNKVALEAVALKREKDDLKMINTGLRREIQDHLNTLSSETDAAEGPITVRRMLLNEVTDKRNRHSSVSPPKTADTDAKTKEQAKGNKVYVRECTFAPRTILN